MGQKTYPRLPGYDKLRKISNKIHSVRKDGEYEQISRAYDEIFFDESPSSTNLISAAELLPYFKSERYAYGSFHIQADRLQALAIKMQNFIWNNQTDVPKLREGLNVAVKEIDDMIEYIKGEYRKKTGKIRNNCKTCPAMP